VTRQLAADSCAGLDHYDVVATLGATSRCFEAGDAAPDHDRLRCHAGHFVRERVTNG
jgi:hypothetical protein